LNHHNSENIFKQKEREVVLSKAKGIEVANDKDRKNKESMKKLVAGELER